MMKWVSLIFSTAAAIDITVAHASSLSDVPICPDVGKPHALVSKIGTYEAAAFDANGHLIISNWLGNKVQALDAPGAKLRTVDTFLWRPGGLALTPDGSMLVGSGIDALALLAPKRGFAHLRQLDLSSGVDSVYASGLSMGNGVVRAEDGTVFASNDLAPAIDRIDPDGTVHRGWYHATPANGLALSADGRTLYANVSLGGTHTLAIDTTTAQARTYFEPPAELKSAFMDDLDIDKAGRLYAAVYFGGQVWRIDTDGSFCALARGLVLPAGISVGAGGAGFSPSSVYVTTHAGKIIEIPNAIPADGVNSEQ